MYGNSSIELIGGKSLIFCDNQDCSRPRIKRLERAHDFLCEKSSLYHSWHHHPHHRKVHFSILGIFVLTMAAMILQTVLIKPYNAKASESWLFDFSVPANYTLSDGSLIEVADNQSKLKVREYAADQANTSALYHLNETEGTAVDDVSEFNNNGTASNLSWSGEGKLNGAASFNGTTSNISVPTSDSLNISNANTIEAWTKFNSEFTDSSHNHRQFIATKGGYSLYYDHATGKIVYELADSNPEDWGRVSGNDISGPWDLNGKLTVYSQVWMGNDLYIGTGNAISDAEVWKWNGTSWLMIGGDSINLSWAINTYEIVMSLATDGTNIYAGLGTGANDAMVWKWNGTVWSNIGNQNIWGANYTQVNCLNYMSGVLYAGIGGATAGMGEVWKYENEAWGIIADVSVGFPAGNAYEHAYSMTNDGTNLYVGMGLTANDADVWKYGGGSWSKIGGDDVTNWNGSYEYVLSLVYTDGTLYAGLGNSANDADVFQYSGSDVAWSQIGGDGTGWGANYDGVYSMVGGGGKLYVGLGLTAGENEVWVWNGSSWTQLGGDGLRSGFTNTHTVASSLSYANDTIYVGLTAASYSGYVWSYSDADMSDDTWNGTWTRFGGNGIKGSWGYYGLETTTSMAVTDGKLYAGTGTSAGDALVWQYDGTNWLLIGGQNTNGSWAVDTYEQVNCMVSYKGDLYVGLGLSASEAEVWRWNGSSWSQIGGDGTGWGSDFDHVYSMAVYKDKLYVGLGLTANESEVWEYDGTNWTALPIGGDGRNGSWNTSYEMVYSLVSDGNYLYAGLGNGTGDAEVWRYDGATWGGARIGGDGDHESWINSTYQTVESMTIFKGELIVGLGYATAGHAEVWKWNGSTWGMIGGDGNGGWDNFQYERVISMAVYNGELYASLGNTAGDGEIFVYSGNGTSWTKSAGFSLGNWVANIEYATALTVYNGKLYAGTGASANSDGGVWSYGSNGYLTSETVGQDTNWHHIAATYDGSSMKIYIDGVLNSSTNTTKSIKTTSLPLYIGTSIGISENGVEPGYFNGMMDELRISNIARTSFFTSKYSNQEQLVQPDEAVLTSQVKAWSGFLASETLNGGTINYRLSDNGGSTWKYWNGSWALSGPVSQANSSTDINDHIATFPVTTGGILWQAILKGNGEQLVILASVSIEYEADADDPLNPTVITAKDSLGGAVTLNDEGWAKYPTPSFSWNTAETAGGATDSGGAGVDGYFVYFGEANQSDECVGDPVTTPGILTPNSGGLYYQTGTTLTIPQNTLIDSQSGKTFCLRLMTKDKAGNIQNTPWQAFKYRFDNQAPSLEHTTISVDPDGWTSEDSFTFTIEPGATDPATSSSFSKYQYRTDGDPVGQWFDLDINWDTSDPDNPVLLATELQLPNEDHPVAKYQTGTNYLRLRIKDNAKNDSSVLMKEYKFNNSSPLPPSNLTVDGIDGHKSENNFTFTWSAPEGTPVGETVTYHYAVNKLPLNAGNTITTTLSGVSGALADQANENTFYVVAEVRGLIDYNNYASIPFYADVSDPSPPNSVIVSDISNKNEEATEAAKAVARGLGMSEDDIAKIDEGEYRVVISWTQPTVFDSANFSKYAIYGTTTPNNTDSYTKVGETQGTAYVHLDLKKDDTWYYYVKTVAKTTNESMASNNPATTTSDNMPHETATGKFKFAPSINENTNCTKSGTLCDDGKKVKYSIGARMATFGWNTSRNARPEIQYGLSKDTLDKPPAVGISASSSSHEVSVTGLNPETKYYYRVVFSDSDGNIGYYPSLDQDPLNFTTTPSPKVATLKVDNLTLTSMYISWQSTISSHGSVIYKNASSSKYEEPVEESSGNYSTDHSATLKNLTSGTAYVFQINAIDEEGNLFESDEYIQTTLPMPRVNDDLKAQNKTGIDSPTINVEYTTNVETTTVIKYSTGGASAKSFIDLAKTKTHTAEISGLAPKAPYILEVTGTDNYGNEAIAKTFQITTESDTMPPKIISISDKKRVIGDGANAEAQITVKVTTNEPTTMVVEAAEGVGGDQFGITSNEDPLNTEHTVPLKLKEAGKTYSYRVTLKDAAGNPTISETKTVVIQKANKTAFEYTLSIFSRSFGWLSTIINPKK